MTSLRGAGLLDQIYSLKKAAIKKNQGNFLTLAF